jgi:hypothetical protein
MKIAIKSMRDANFILRHLRKENPLRVISGGEATHKE